MKDIRLSINEVKQILDNLNNPFATAGLDDLGWLMTKEDENKQIGWNVQGKIRIQDYAEIAELIDAWNRSICSMAHCKNRFVDENSQHYCKEHRH